MKIVYDSNEKDILQKVYDELPNVHMLDVSDPDMEYSLNFKITNPCIADYILRGLLCNKLEDFDLGIKVTSINLRPTNGIEELRQKLHCAIDEIIQ